MWLIGVEVEQETSAPPPKKNPGSARDTWQVLSFILLDKLHKYLRDFRLSRFDDPRGTFKPAYAMQDMSYLILLTTQTKYLE